MSADLSIIIPVYNRGELIRYTLESVRRAGAGLAVEVIIVDDGSDHPAADDIARLGYTPTRVIRQANQGLLFARLEGLRTATGRYTIFLDSDDLVSPEKFRLQVSALEQSGAEVCYTDSAHTTLVGEYDGLVIEPDTPSEDTTDGATFFIRVQPPPHSPVFRTSFLRRVVTEACFPPDRLYNPVAEIWFYHNAAPLPARAIRVRGPHTIVGRHPGTRLTQHWERLGVASLAVMEAFSRGCPRTSETTAARQLVAEKAFNSWRRLPRGFAQEFGRRQLNLWRRLNQQTELNRLGGRSFQRLAATIGPVAAGRLMQWIQNDPYDSCRTLSDEAVAALLTILPAPE
jgi:Glycosyl transferase family 2